MSASAPGTFLLGTAAAELAAKGYHAHPLRPRAKVPATPRGFKDATSDPAQIAEWWRAMPTSNIGVACGASGVAVLDIDAKLGADPRVILARFDRHGAPVVGTGRAERSPDYPRALHGRRGVQVYFRGNMPSAARLTIPGCEIKGAGGYVVAPPSIHPSGVEYVGELPSVDELPPIPAWLLELAQRQHRGPRSFPTPAIRPGCAGPVLDGLVRTVERAEVGSRNRCLFWAACRACEHIAAG
ncbi:MAG: bifunctional DNA primase/polymerase, partial [Solirubrobacteraceae bacterium]